MNGINVATTVTVNWAELGVEFAGLTSDDQARFLLAFGEAISPMQHAYISSDIARELLEDPDGYYPAKQGLIQFALHILDSLEAR